MRVFKALGAWQVIVGPLQLVIYRFGVDVWWEGKADVRVWHLGVIV